MILLLSVTLSCSTVKKPINNNITKTKEPLSPCDDPKYDEEFKRLLCN